MQKMKKLTVYTDGASRGNPGPASYGFCVFDKKGKLLHQEGGYIGKTTNNVAEYQAVFEALKFIYQNLNLTNNPLQIKFYADSELVARQLQGRYKVKNPKLKSLFDLIKNLEKSLGKVSYTHVPRGQNILADELANQALNNNLPFKL